MNEAGLILSTMGLGATREPPPDTRPPLDSGLWMQYLLDTCATIDEVIASDEHVRIVSTVDHYLVADRYGNSAVVEFIDGERLVHWGPDLPVAVLSNTPYAVCRDNWFAFLDYRPWLSADDSVNRFVTAGAAVVAFQHGTSDQAVKYAFNVLRDVGDGRSSQSFVYDGERRRVYYRTLANPQVRFIDLDAFDPDCHSPVQMLDVNADLPGDLSDDFFDFDYGLSLAFYRRCVESFGYTVTIPLEAIMTHLASFPCTEAPAPAAFCGGGSMARHGRRAGHDETPGSQWRSDNRGSMHIE